MPALEHHERNFNTPRICRVYENTRESDCKGVKEGEALRRVRTGPDAGLAIWGKPAKPKSRHLPKSTAGDFATTATDSAQSLIKSRLVENSYDGAFVRVRFSAAAFRHLWSAA
jgi:hypothetical protein